MSALAAMLAIRQNRLDASIGISRVTPKVASLLLAYDRAVMSDIRQVASGAMLMTILDAGHKRTAEICDNLGMIDESDLPELLNEACKLQHQSKKALAAIGALNATT